MKTAPASGGVAAEQHPVLDTARAVLEVEAQAVSGLIRRLDAHFVRAVELIMSRRGRVIVSGIGKSGHIARKIASTFASTGTPAYFVNGRMLSGARPFESFAELIDEELAAE